MGVISHNRTCLCTAAMNLTGWVSTGGEEGNQLRMAGARRGSWDQGWRPQARRLVAEPQSPKGTCRILSKFYESSLSLDPPNHLEKKEPSSQKHLSSFLRISPKETEYG